MTEPSMAERIAQALAECECTSPSIWERSPEAFRQRYRVRARIILAAMRDPTASTIRAGHAAGDRNDGLVWRMMIDRALKE